MFPVKYKQLLTDCFCMNLTLNPKDPLTDYAKDTGPKAMTGGKCDGPVKIVEIPQ